jgi:O-glycosyl hydrolase
MCRGVSRRVSHPKGELSVKLHLRAHPFGWAVATCLLSTLAAVGQVRPPVDASVSFDKKLQDWDGFGANYVQSANAKDYNKNKEQPQDYGGFSKLNEKQRQEILDMIFGPDGLKPGLIKLFLDPLHEGMTVADKGKFDHESSTRWMNYFTSEGLKKTRARGGDLQIMTAMWSPPGWMTKQKFMNGRDVDPAMKEEVAKYMIDWVKFLRNHENIPVKYLSLHNEGDMWTRWPADGSSGGGPSASYAMWWSPEQAIDFLRFMRPMMDKEGLKDVGLTPGESAKWVDFSKWWSPALIADPVALKNIGLITSHGFNDAPADITSLGVDTMRVARPELHAWTTSMNCAPNGNNIWVEQVRLNIYSGKVNGIIPWACIAADPWTGGPEDIDRNSWNGWVGTGIWVDGAGGYSIEDGYYLVKHVFRAGQPGMAVAEVRSSDRNIGLIAFARNGTGNSDAVVINSVSGDLREVNIRMSGTNAGAFDAFLTDPARRKKYSPLSTIPVNNGVLKLLVPGGSTITLFAKQ